ncbi:acetyltransferase [Bacillus pseudomycoides]|uniref:Acetyltransferase n=1 Tax=Bacillus pseudomycoides TaxID=64104 RepID=A0AA91VB91_9BACI|nr:MULTISPECIES: acyltransferase [Bacillus]PEB56279.1 acetyltransferase [Bacillus sp. AFS098217]PED81709.1 acetyltransferase [Bacillus pseudomycoides]PEU09358.1 acetyltransferase [Bacillus sp. AFS014408]PEU10637.1 acetyltransferase [Bacillus sp. AFS019443]PFW64252.1 acetyltransferase [Bacillus sp. AFS075034]
MIKKIINFCRARFRKFVLEEIWLEDYIKMGMKIGDNCSIQPGVIIDYSHCWLIKIGNNVTIAPQAYLLVHDASTKKLNNYTKVGSILIEDNVFIGARALIMPGVTIGKNSIVAAGSIVTKSIPSESIVAGNPAKVISTIEKYEIDQNKKNSEVYTKIYDRRYTLGGNISECDRRKMYEELINKIGFVE